MGADAEAGVPPGVLTDDRGMSSAHGRETRERVGIAVSAIRPGE